MEKKGLECFLLHLVSWWEKKWLYTCALKCSRFQMCWISVLIIFHYRQKNIYFTNFWVLVVGSSFCHNNLYRKKNLKVEGICYRFLTFYFKYQLKMLAVSRMGFNTFLLSLIKFSVKICWAGFESRWVKMNIDNSILASFPWYYWYIIHL